MLKIIVEPKASKELLKIPKKARLRVLDKIAELQMLNHPLQHPKVIKLEGRGEEYRLRVGDYRIKFTFQKPSDILITHIQQRQVGF